MNIPRQPWVERAKKNITDLVDGNRTMAFQFVVCEPDAFTGLQGLRASKAGKCRTILDHELDLNNQLEGLRKRFEMGYEDDFVYSLHPYTGIGLFASAFGCVTTFPDIGDPVTHPAIASIDRIDRLKPDIGNADLIQLTLAKIKHFQGRTGGQVAIAFPDLQSPINVASIVMDYTELLCAMKTDPGKVHALLQMITDVMEQVLAELGQLLPGWNPSAHLWLPKGLWLSDDLLAVLSPKDYQEFAWPYADRLARKYGGVCLHSCGNPLAAVSVLKTCPRLMMLDFWEVTLEQFHQAGGDFLCSCAVITDPWHNLDRRSARHDNYQAVHDALNDLGELKKHLRSPIWFTGVCPHPDFADDYYCLLSTMATKER